MFGRTLSFYFARHFAKMVGAIFILAFLLTAAVTYFEFFTRAFKGEAVAGMLLAAMALLKVPSLVEDSLPFAVLYGSIAAFVIANRRLEVVIARAAGVSAWQFLLPACAVGLIAGILATTVYNPAAATFRSWSGALGSRVFTAASQPQQSTEGNGPVWARQKADDGTESIIGSVQSYDEGLGLLGVTAYVFDAGGHFRERVDAPRRTTALGRGAWKTLPSPRSAQIRIRRTLTSSRPTSPRTRSSGHSSSSIRCHFGHSPASRRRHGMRGCLPTATTCSSTCCSRARFSFWQWYLSLPMSPFASRVRGTSEG